MVEHARELPPQPSLEQQKKSAKELLKAYRADDPEAIERIRRHLPDKPRITLADSQFVVAREYGFASWPALRSHIDALDAAPREPVADRFRRAVGTADVANLRRLLQGEAAARRLINAPIFAFDSPAIVAAAGAGNEELIATLLEFGADPNVKSAWWAGGFHALYSARGAVADRLIAAGAVMDACAAAQLDRPDELARLLDAEPARVRERGGDGQTPLHFARSREVVDLLLERGADVDARDVDHRATPAEWMLQVGRRRGRYDLARYLVERGASADIFLAAALGLTDRLRELIEEDPSRLELRTGEGEYGELPPSSYHIYTWTIGDHLSPLQVAVQFEQEEAAELLARSGSDSERFLTACGLGDAATAERLLAARPDLVATLGPRDMRALPDAAWHGKLAAVELMLRLGFDPAARGQDGGTVLHCAAWQGWVDCVEAGLRHDGVRRLLEDRDPTHGSTALGWCFHGARYCRNSEGDYAAVARLLIAAGARLGPNAGDAPPELLAMARSMGAEIRP
jgi:ankyrin repeat protein